MLVQPISKLAKLLCLFRPTALASFRLPPPVCRAWSAVRAKFAHRWDVYLDGYPKQTASELKITASSLLYAPGYSPTAVPTDPPASAVQILRAALCS